MEVTIDQIITPEEFVKVVDICKTTDNYKRAERVRKEIIEPNIKRINNNLGQENDPGYLAYAVIYSITSAMKEELENAIK